MSLEQIYYVSQTAAAVAVVASLLFVGFQIRHGTRATRAQIHQNITLGWLALGPMISRNAGTFAAGLAADEATFTAMRNEDKMTFLSIMFAFFKHYENMYEQYQEGFLRSEDWNAWVTHMFMYWRMPGVQLWWRFRREAFAPGFRRFIETSAQSPMPSTVEIFSKLPLPPHNRGGNTTA